MNKSIKLKTFPNTSYQEIRPKILKKKKQNNKKTKKGKKAKRFILDGNEKQKKNSCSEVSEVCLLTQITSLAHTTTRTQSNPRERVLISAVRPDGCGEGWWVDLIIQYLNPSEI